MLHFSYRRVVFYKTLMCCLISSLLHCLSILNYPTKHKLCISIFLLTTLFLIFINISTSSNHAKRSATTWKMSTNFFIDNHSLCLAISQKRLNKDGALSMIHSKLFGFTVSYFHRDYVVDTGKHCGCVCVEVKLERYASFITKLQLVSWMLKAS